MPGRRDDWLAVGRNVVQGELLDFLEGEPTFKHQQVHRMSPDSFRCQGLRGDPGQAGQIRFTRRFRGEVDAPGLEARGELHRVDERPRRIVQAQPNGLDVGHDPIDLCRVCALGARRRWAAVSAAQRLQKARQVNVRDGLEGQSLSRHPSRKNPEKRSVQPLRLRGVGTVSNDEPIAPLAVGFDGV